MRGTRFLLACSAATLLSMSGLAHADAHHQILSQSPIKGKGGRVLGFRATVLLDPDNKTSTHAELGGDVRLGLGSMKHVDFEVDDYNSNNHRSAVAGVRPGYLVHQLKMREVTGPNATDRGPLVETLNTGGQQKEVEIEVLYRDNPRVVPGTKVDLVASFWKSSYWHVWGAADGPIHSSNDFVIELPGRKTSTGLKRAIANLAAEEHQAQMTVDATKPQVDSAKKAQDAAQAAYDAAVANLNATKAHVKTMDAALTLAQGRVTVATAQSTALKLQLAAMQPKKADAPADTQAATSAAPAPTAAPAATPAPVGPPAPTGAP